MQVDIKPKAKRKSKSSDPVPKNKQLYSRVKSEAKRKFDVYPSAYANAWAAKQYKAAGGGWKKGK